MRVAMWSSTQHGECILKSFLAQLTLCRLTRLWLFVGLDLDQLKCFCGFFLTKRLEPGTLLYKQGTLGDAMYACISGTLDENMQVQEAEHEGEKATNDVKVCYRLSP